MKFGHATHPRRDIVPEIDWAAEHGFDFVELFLEPDEGAIERVDAAAIRAALDRCALGTMGHLACYLPIGSPLVQLRRAAGEIAIEYLRVFSELAVPAVTIHANWPSGMFTVDEGLAWQHETLNTVLDACRDLGVQLLYEPVTTAADDPEILWELFDAFPDLMCNLDTGHANLCGREPPDMIRALGPRIAHMHVHDNNGNSDLHLPPGTGNIDWEETFAALREAGYNGTMTLEIFSRDRDYLLLAKRKIERLANSPVSSDVESASE